MSGTRLALTVCVTAAVAVQLYPFLLWSAEQIAAHGMLRDDAFFYGVIARNIHRLGFPTFDGQMPTNGVQPLWAGLLAALQKLAPGAHVMTIVARASWVTYVAFAAASTWWLTGVSASRGPLLALGFAALVTANAGFQRWVVAGLETPLLLLLLVGFLSQIARMAARLEGSEDRPIRSREIALLAILAAVCFLARTDQLGLSVLGFGVVAWGPRRQLRHAVVYAAATAAAVLPYLAANLVAFGAVMPISGRVKRFSMERALPSFEAYVGSIEWQGLPHAVAAVLPWGLELPLAAQVGLAVIVVVLPLAWVLRDWLRGVGERCLPLWLRLLAGAAVAHLLLMYGWYRELRPYSSYYFVIEVVTVGLAASVWLSRREPVPTLPGRRRLSGLATAGLVLLGCFVVAASLARFGQLRPKPYWEANLRIASQLATLPSERTVGAYWPGVLGAFMDRPVLPLDGILGSNEFFEDFVRTGNELAYLLARPQPLLALYLHRSPEALLGADEPPYLDRWNRLGETRLWEYRECPMRIVAQELVKAEGDGWYVFDLETSALPDCRLRPIAAAIR